MKKLMTFLFIAIITFYVGNNKAIAQNYSSLPYTTDFSDQADWELQNGECTNKWYIAKPYGASDKMLYISTDGTSVGNYQKNSSSRVLAGKALNLPQSEKITVSFDIEVKGENNYDFLKVFLVPDVPMLLNQFTPATSSIYSDFFGNLSTQYSARFNGNAYIANYTGTVTMQLSNPVKDETNAEDRNAWIIFTWINDGSAGNTPAAIIKNISIKETPENEIIYEAPTNLGIEFDGLSSASFGWVSGSDETTWQVKLGENGTINEVTNPEWQFTALEKGTTYKAFVRSKYNNGHYSDWVSLEFYFNYNPTATPFSTSTTSNSVLLKGRLKQYSFYPAKQYGFAYKQSNEDSYIYLSTVDNISENIFNTNLTGLIPNTWYDVICYTINQDDETISCPDFRKLSFITAGEVSLSAVDMPYTATFNSSDAWHFSNGKPNWYKGTPQGEATPSLFISDDGQNASYTHNNNYFVAFARKNINMGNSDYITVEFDAKVGGLDLVGEIFNYLKVNLVSYDVTYNSVTGEPEEVTMGSTDFNGLYYIEDYTGHVTMYFSNPYPNGTASLIFSYTQQNAENFGLMFDLNNEMNPQIIINNLTVKEAADGFTHCFPPSELRIDWSGDTEIGFRWTYENYPQIKLDNGEIISLEDGVDYYEFKNVYAGEHTVYVRNMCSAESVSEWVEYTFTMPNASNEYFVIMAKPMMTSDNSVKLKSIIANESKNISEIGFEYKKVSESSWTTIDADQVEEYTTYDDWYKSLVDEQSLLFMMKNAVTSTNLIFSMETELTSLASNTDYMVRSYAKHNDGTIEYSETKTFKTGGNGLESIENAVELKLFPNPAKDMTNLVVEGLNDNATVSILDMQGRILSTQNLTRGQKVLQINTSDYVSGIYYVMIQNQNLHKVEKLIIK